MKPMIRKDFMKGTIALLALFIMIDLSFHFQSVRANTETTYNSKEFQSVVSQLDMQGHAEHDISTCTIKSVYYEEVLDAFKEGKTEKEILQSYVDEYGQAALRAPTTEGSGIIAWIMPAIIFLVGAIGVGYGIKKLTNKNISIETEQIAEMPEIEREIVEQTFEAERRKYF